MSSFIIEKTKINDILVHPKADRLQIYKVYDWEVVSQLGKYQIGDEIIYLPFNTVLSQEFETKLFPVGSKITLTKRRVKATSIRGVKSFGMILDPNEFSLEYVRENVSKYEPPVDEQSIQMKAAKPKRAKNGSFKKYTDIENIKYYDRVIADGEMVVVTQKLHGTNFRAGWLPNEANTLWKKLLKLFGLMPQWEFCWGSRNVQIQNKLFHTGYYDEDVYTKMVNQYDLKNRIPKGYVIYGEIVGDKIQKNYMYGCKSGEHKLYVFDVWKDGKYTNHQEFVVHLLEMNLEKLMIPLIYIGPYDKTYIEMMIQLNGLSDETNEGLVIKPVIERESPTIGRVIVKFISPKYYLEENSEFH